MARIATFFRVQIEHQAATLEISATDIDRGYVEVPFASSFSIDTNTPTGIVVDFRARGEVFRSVLVWGLQQTYELGAEGGTAVHNAAHGRTSSHKLGFRFILRPDLQPGNYPWPLQFSVRAA